MLTTGKSKHCCSLITLDRPDLINPLNVIKMLLGKASFNKLEVQEINRTLSLRQRENLNG